jgi:hypothetical protein
VAPNYEDVRSNRSLKGIEMITILTFIALGGIIGFWIFKKSDYRGVFTIILATLAF